MKRVSLGKVIRKSFWYVYDHLGRLILLNVLWFLLGLPWVLAFGAGLFLGWGILQTGNLLIGLCAMLVGAQILFVSPPTAGLLAVCRGDVERQTGVGQGILSMIRRYAVRSQILGLLMAGGTILLCVNLLFYVRIGRLIGLALGGTMGWGLLFWVLVSLSVMPVLIYSDTGLFTVLKRSALTVLGHPFFSLFLLLGTGMLFMVGLVTGVGLVLLAMSLMGVFLNTAFRELIQGHAPIERGMEAEEREEEKRGWRDLLRPWEM